MKLKLITENPHEETIHDFGYETQIYGFIESIVDSSVNLKDVEVVDENGIVVYMGEYFLEGE